MKVGVDIFEQTAKGLESLADEQLVMGSVLLEDGHTDAFNAIAVAAAANQSAASEIRKLVHIDERKPN